MGFSDNVVSLTGFGADDMGTRPGSWVDLIVRIGEILPATCSFHREERSLITSLWKSDLRLTGK